MMPVDVQITLDCNDGRGPRPISPAFFRQLPQRAYDALAFAMAEIADRLVRELKWRYAVAIRERPRVEGEPLKQRLQRALVSATVTTPDAIEALAFDLLKIDQDTRNEGGHTQDHGWFLNFEDGHRGRRHGSNYYGWLPLELALRLAEACAEWANLKNEDRQEFLSYVQEHFAGRHGQGIMVDLDRPLFFRFPDFGTAQEKGVQPHPGYRAWNILQSIPELAPAARTSGNSWIYQALTRAMQRAAHAD